MRGKKLISIIGLLVLLTNTLSVLSITPACKDTDGGKNYFVKGITTYTDRFGRATTYTDSCRFRTLTEYYCYKGNSYKISYSCASGCIDGKCVKTGSCGDSVVNQVGEQCDNGAQNGVVCFPAYLGQCKYCSSVCKEVVLSGSYCGDGIVNSPYEQCDDGNTNSDDGCSSTCDIEFCGDGQLQTGEQCDGGVNCDNMCHTTSIQQVNNTIVSVLTSSYPMSSIVHGNFSVDTCGINIGDKCSVKLDGQGAFDSFGNRGIIQTTMPGIAPNKYFVQLEGNVTTQWVGVLISPNVYCGNSTGYINNIDTDGDKFSYTINGTTCTNKPSIADDVQVFNIGDYTEFSGTFTVSNGNGKYLGKTGDGVINVYSTKNMLAKFAYRANSFWYATSYGVISN